MADSSKEEMFKEFCRKLGGHFRKDGRIFECKIDLGEDAESIEITRSDDEIFIEIGADRWWSFKTEYIWDLNIWAYQSKTALSKIRFKRVEEEYGEEVIYEGVEGRVALIKDSGKKADLVIRYNPSLYYMSITLK